MWRVCTSPQIKHPGGSGALSSRPKRDPGPLPIYQDFLLLSNHTPDLKWFTFLFQFCIMPCYVPMVLIVYSGLYDSTQLCVPNGRHSDMKTFMRNQHLPIIQFNSKNVIRRNDTRGHKLWIASSKQAIAYCSKVSNCPWSSRSCRRYHQVIMYMYYLYKGDENVWYCVLLYYIPYVHGRFVFSQMNFMIDCSIHYPLWIKGIFY